MGLWDSIAGGVGSLWGGATDAVGGVWNAGSNAVGSVWGAGTNAVGSIWDTGKSAVGGIWGGVGKASGSGSSVFDSLAGLAGDYFSSQNAADELERQYRLQQQQYDAAYRRDALAAQTAAQNTLPSWVIPVGLGSVVLLAVALVAMRRK